MEMVVSNKEKMNPPGQVITSEENLAVIVVAGVTSGAGKTSLAEAVTGILNSICPTAAAKITVTHGDRGCPHGGKGCDVCGTLGGDFQVITRSSILEQTGTDTARLLEAGASRVLWAITREEFIGDAWRAMLGALTPDTRAIVVESNTLALYIKPMLTLMVADPTVSRKLWKRSAERLIASADILIFNDRGEQQQKRQALLEEVGRLRASTAKVLFVQHPHAIAQDSAFIEELRRVLRNHFRSVDVPTPEVLLEAE